MKYSSNKIKRSGIDLIGSDEFKRMEAIKVINDWRLSFQPHIEAVEESISKLFEQNNITALHSSRIKRMPSIVEKLRNKSDMGLGTLQDIGGVRFIFDTLDDTYKAYSILSEYEISGYTREKIYDYIGGDKAPKESGYRSIHFVYKSKSEDENADGYRVEVQLRDKLQHCWAMALETASLVAKTSLKADKQDAKDWRQFFKLVSAVFSVKEQTKILPEYELFTQKQLCKEYDIYRHKLKLVDKLQALSVAVLDMPGKLSANLPNYSFCLLVLDYNMKAVQTRFFTSIDEAGEQFGELEKWTANDSNKAVLLASVDDMNYIREAYPSFFLDTKAFFAELAEFETQCKLIKL